ncbi:hypothetical protein JYT58_01015 [bacterium AH-315-G11]|nr:hypothetical protein [bacterium AH-315-G11]
MQQNGNNAMNKMVALRGNAFMILVVIGIIAVAGTLLYSVSLVFNPLFLLLILPAWVIYLVSKQYIQRRISLNRFGYFAGRRVQKDCVYEEYINGKLLKFRLKLENTEPGHWELFVPSKDEWHSTAPEWARDRRAEIIERIKPHFKSTDIHFPDDFKIKESNA